MKQARQSTLPIVLVVATAMAACGDVPIDDTRNDARLFPARGVIRGTVTYVGPRPCSRDGHIVGNAVVLVFDRRNPPPPAGIASAAVNFVAVPGDALFVNEPRSVGPTLFCPSDQTSITASVPFTIAPLEGGSYQLSAFYDRRGRFWPTFKFRNLPEAGDIGGGFIDIEDARKNAGNPNYQPLYLPVDVGTPQPGAAAGTIPDFVIDHNGYVADNIPVTVGSVVPFTRPYFHPRKNDGSNEGPENVGMAATTTANPTGDRFAVPIIVMTQDATIFAPPKTPTPKSLTDYQSRFVSVKMVWGVPATEVDTATSPDDPFGLQLPPLPPKGNGGLLVFAKGVSIAENPAVPDLWPQVAFVKLADDPFRRTDPQSLVIQGTPEESTVTGKPPGPVVIIQGITLLDDSLAKTIAGPLPQAPTSAALRDHVTVLVKPAALCFDPRRIDVGGLLVTPHLTGQTADTNETAPLFDQAALAKVPIVREIQQGCLPKGRYAMTLVYPTGQAWTVPNEIGGCAPSEGAITPDGDVSSCSAKPRHVLLSQGARAVLEVVDALPADQATCDDHPVPAACTKL